jgi:hypothetical protein
MKHAKRLAANEDGTPEYHMPREGAPEDVQNADRFVVDVSHYLDRWERVAMRKAPEGVHSLEVLNAEDIAALERAEQVLAFLSMAGQMHIDGALTDGIPPEVTPEALTAQDNLRESVSVIHRMLDLAREVRKDTRPRKVRRLAGRKGEQR